VEDENNDVDKRVGANVARYRTAKGMSQADLAADLATLGGIHVHQQTIAKIEKGTRSLKFMEGVMIAELLTVDVDDLSVGHNEAIQAAAQLETLEDIRRIGEELDDIGERLAYHLLRLAVGLGIDRTKQQADDETRAPAGESAGWIESQALDLLKRNWGRELNVRVELAMRRQPYLAEIRSEFAAPTYGEVLKRVSESPIIGTEYDATEA
jgi:transcriptional regulator with XRE-family HTH domain